jgi:3-oxoacyl-[acyl-carrier protein] reductase
MLNKKLIVITGGNGNIAKAIAEKCGDYNVLTPSRQELNVCDEKSVNNFFSNKKVDILINNAGYIVPKSLKDHATYEDVHTIDVNLKGVFLCTIAAHKTNNNTLKVINIGSSAGTKPRGTWGAYCASKAALIMLTQCWFDEGIDVYCLSPGRTATKMRYNLFGSEDKETLMSVDDFAKVARLAIDGKLKAGINLDVNINNIGEYLENAG